MTDSEVLTRRIRSSQLIDLGDQLRTISLEELALVARPSQKGHATWLDVMRMAIRRAEVSHAEIISTWITNNDELRWLGGDPRSPIREQVAEWIRSAHAAFVLTYRERAGELPVAFAILAPWGPHAALSTPEVEVGRLLVDPQRRRRGFGSTLLGHLGCVAAIAANRGIGMIGEPHARVYRDNAIALNMVRQLPFAREDAPAWAASEEDAYDWFHFRSHARPSLLGTVVRNLREKRGLSQAMLGFQCGVQRATINMIEAGERNPSVNVLRSLCAVLAETELDRVRLLLATIGESPSKSLRSYEPLNIPNTVDHDALWIIADTLAESLDCRFASSSRRAIAMGCDRWYFLPPGVLLERGPELLELFRDSETSEEMRLRHLRFYAAPEILCQLRIEIRNPHMFNADRVTFEGEALARVPMSSDCASAILLDLRAAISAIDTRNHRGEEPSSYGFTLCYPYQGRDELAPRYRGGDESVPR